jgi:hypothetical protein
VKITKKATVDFSAADPTYTLTNDPPTSIYNTLNFLAVFACTINGSALPPVVSLPAYDLPTTPGGGMLQHAALSTDGSRSYCYGSGGAPMWYDIDTSVADIVPQGCGAISVVSSYGDGI